MGRIGAVTAPNGPRTGSNGTTTDPNGPSTDPIHHFRPLALWIQLAGTDERRQPKVRENGGGWRFSFPIGSCKAPRERSGEIREVSTTAGIIPRSPGLDLRGHRFNYTT